MNILFGGPGVGREVGFLLGIAAVALVLDIVVVIVKNSKAAPSTGQVRSNA
ncbi:hypothetical protein D3C71_2152420 [compost metagenome]